MSAQFTSPIEARRFILAGNSRFTLVSERTQVRYTYKLSECEDNPSLRFLSLLTGPDNSNDYTYIGLVVGIERVEYKWTRKVKLQPDSKPILAFTHVLKHLEAGKLPPGCQIWHEGRCGRCARTLTVPASIAAGIGPDCAQAMGFSL